MESSGLELLYEIFLIQVHLTSLLLCKLNFTNLKENPNEIFYFAAERRIAVYEDKTEGGSGTSKYRHSTKTREKEELYEKQSMNSRTVQTK